MSAIDWLQWLLLPIIAAAAFTVTRSFFRVRVDRLRADRDVRLRRTLKAMQQLLDEKPDEALRSVLGLIATDRSASSDAEARPAVELEDSVWLSTVQRDALDRDTLEMHVIIGRLLRRQGDFERAIRVHETLLGVATLDPAKRGILQLELARDFMAAGVYDRAETTLRGLLNDPQYAAEAHRLLLSILEIQREWGEAERVAEALITSTRHTTSQGPIGDSLLTDQSRDAQGDARTDAGVLAPDRRWLTSLRAHYVLERATVLLGRGQVDAARALTERAAEIAPGLPRTELMRADCAARSGAYEMAISHAKSAVQAQPSLAALGIARIERFARHLSGTSSVTMPLTADGHTSTGVNSETLVIDALRDIQRLHPSAFGAIALTRALRRSGQLDEALNALREVLAMRPVPISGLLEAVRWMKVLPSSQPYFSDFEAFERALADQLARQPLYQCSHCGFEGRQHVWHCPSCRRWDSFRALDIDPDALDARQDVRPHSEIA